MVFVGLLCVPFLSRLVMVDKRILLPVISVLSVIGAYAIRFSFFDVWVAIIMGIVGLGMKRWGFSASPVVLALILGPMAESNLRRSMLLPDSDLFMFLSRPISAVLLIFAVGTVLFGLIRQFRSNNLHVGSLDG